MSRLNEYNRDFGIVFDELDDLINSIPVGGGGESTIVEEPVKDSLLDTKTIKGVTYKMYKRDKAYREAPNGALTRTPEYDLEPSKPASTGVVSPALAALKGVKPSA